MDLGARRIFVSCLLSICMAPPFFHRVAAIDKLPADIPTDIPTAMARCRHLLNMSMQS